MGNWYSLQNESSYASCVPYSHCSLNNSSIIHLHQCVTLGKTEKYNCATRALQPITPAILLKDTIIALHQLHPYRNPSLGFATKAMGCKVTGQKGSSGVMLHAPESARECDRISPHTHKGTPTLGNWSPDGLLNVQRTIIGVKTQWIKEFFISLESY